ncbi:MAG TPA: DUF6526 family protein [Thermoanaerobaculia bacterium]|nr:DUF6526 family protein [Thermoanaerobaculia bacterium]
MPEPAAQNFQTHRRFVPLHHFVAALILLLNLLWAFYRIWHAYRDGGRFNLVDSIFYLLVAFALLLMWFYLRLFPLTAQDRLIRFEMRHRLEQVLPVDLRPRIGELGAGQLIALRFASDAELPDLTRQVLEQRIQSRDQIKKLIKDWQADDLRV